MARKSKPWWWEERQGYYAFVRGARLRLGDTKKQADDELKRLLKQEPQQPTDRTSLAILLDDFLDFVKENRAPKTFRGYRDFCESFLTKYPRLTIDELSPGHVTEWLKGQSSWNSTTKRGAITCLQRALNWSKKNNGLKVNVLAGMEKPLAKTRTTIVSEDEFKTLLAAIHDKEFKDLLLFSYDCGCRPQEAKQLEARHIELGKQRAVLPTEEAKGKRNPRAIYIPTTRALKIIKQRLKDFPEGKLFRNRNGQPWTASAVKCRFDKLQIAIGIAEMKRRGIKSKVTDEAIDRLAEKLSPTKKTRFGETRQKAKWELRNEAKLKLIAEEAKPFGVRFRHYDLRHTFITRKLVAGADSHVVAALSGHSDTAMLDKVYSKVAQDHRFMLQAAKLGD